MIKRVVISLILVLLLVSSVIALDLSEFPEMFIDNGNTDVLVIIGKAAKTEDVIGAVDIVVALQYKVRDKKIDVVRLDDEVDAISDQNVIIIGGPCANSAAAKLLGYPINCLEGFELGKGYIRLYEFNNGNIAMLVAGTQAIDTRRVARVLKDYEDYNLNGTEMVVSEVTLNDLEVNTK